MRAYLTIGTVPVLTFIAVVMFTWTYLGSTSAACAGTMSFDYEASSDCGYQQPHNTALSADGKYLYVPEVRRHRIVVLDATSLAYVSEIGRGELKWPHDVSVGPDNRLYIADSGNDRVAIYEVTGTTATFHAELKGDFDNPEGVFAHPDGRVFVSGEDSGSVAVFEDRRQLNSINGLSRPHGIGLADDGGVWIAMSGIDELQHFDTALKPTGRKIDEPLSGPRYMALSNSGYMFLAEKQAHNIVVLTPEGKVAARLGAGQPGFGPGFFNGPEGVAVSNDALWVTDTSNGRIVRYSIRNADQTLAAGTALRPSLF